MFPAAFGAGLAHLAHHSCGFVHAALTLCAVCAPGYGGPGCRPCAAGSFSVGGSAKDPTANCTPCPVNFTTATARASAAGMCTGAFVQEHYSCARGMGDLSVCSGTSFSPTPTLSRRPCKFNISSLCWWLWRPPVRHLSCRQLFARGQLLGREAPLHAVPWKHEHARARCNAPQHVRVFRAARWVSLRGKRVVPVPASACARPCMFVCVRA